MDIEDIKKSVLLAGRLGHVFVATADDKGVPHVAVAGALSHQGGAVVSVSAWFCPVTLSNLESNHNISIVVWDKASDTGYQLLGESGGMETVAVMDGYSSISPEDRPFPQVERRVSVKVSKIIDFMHALHSDRERQA
jgi:uncharacterized protein